MTGTVALVGAGEFLPVMEELDRDLLRGTGRDRPRVVILPTASAPEGDRVLRSWADRGADHFTALGAEVEPVLVRTVAEGHDPAAIRAVGEADLVYLSGGNPAHLAEVLLGSPLGAAVRAAHARGAVVAGCSAGAMAVAARTVAPRRLARLPLPLPFPLRWRDGLAITGSLAVLPHYDAFPEPIAAAMALQAPRGTVVLGIDEETAAVGRAGTWLVRGRGRVTVWRGRRRERHRHGEAFRIP